MKLHLAAVLTTGWWRDRGLIQRVHPAAQRHRQEVPYLLESYHYFNNDNMARKLRDGGEQVFLDSGAFSAWSKGVTIDLDGYCDFAQKNADLFTVVSVLDVIGSAEGTWHNQQEMEKRGVRPIPCFHYGEDLRWCDYYVKNYEYLALGGFGVANRKQIRQWLDRVWDRCLLDGSGNPRIKVHGFAITAIPLMERYPWYSVDSSSWVQIARIGAIYHPDWGPLMLSTTSPLRKFEGMHYENMSPIQRRAIRESLEATGYTVEGLSTQYAERHAYCMWAYCEINRRLNRQGPTLQHFQEELF
jgi:hypothetical protein